MNARAGLCAGAVLAAAAFTTSCSSTPSVSPGAMDQVNAILQEVSVRYAEEGASRCLSTVKYREVEIIDENRLIFHGVGDRAWLNELRRRCPGLRRRDSLALAMRNSRACELDMVSVIDEFTLEQTGPSCTLGVFKPIPPGHVALIEDLMSGRAPEE